MDPRLYLLSELRPFCRQQRPYYWNDVSWEDATFIRACELRMQRGDASGWDQFLDRLQCNYRLSCAILQYFEAAKLLRCDWERKCVSLADFPTGRPSLSDDDARKFLSALDYWQRDFGKSDAFSEPRKASAGEIRYIEEKPGLSGSARIGRVQFSKTQKTSTTRVASCNR